MTLLFTTIWCARLDLNQHGVVHTPLKRARLPIPPRAHKHKALCEPTNILWKMPAFVNNKLLSKIFLFSFSIHVPYLHCQLV